MKAVSSAFPHCRIPWKLRGPCAAQECQQPLAPGCPAHLDLDAEDGPVLGEAEGLEPRQVGKAHRVSAQRVHVLVTATLWGQATRSGKSAPGCLFTRWGVGTPHTFISFSPLCTCTKSPSPLSMPGFSFLKSVPDTRSVPRAAVNGSSQLSPTKGRPETARKWTGQRQVK